MNAVPLRQTYAEVQVSGFIRSVYNWMAVGLGLTGLVAYTVANSETMTSLIYGNPVLFYGLIIGELELVFFISARVNKISSSTATALFVLYAALNGITLSFIFLVFAKATIASTFFICAATFVASSIYGMATKRRFNLRLAAL